MGSTQLTARLFRSVLSGLPQKQEDGHRRRSQPRVGFRAQVTLYPYDNGQLSKPIPVWCRDLSVNGIGIVSEVRLRPRKQFVLFLAGEESDGLCLLYEVLRSEGLPERRYRVGGKLIEELSLMQFKSLLLARNASSQKGPAQVQMTPSNIAIDPPLLTSTSAAVDLEAAYEAEIQRIRSFMFADAKS